MSFTTKEKTEEPIVVSLREHVGGVSVCLDNISVIACTSSLGVVTQSCTEIEIEKLKAKGVKFQGSFIVTG